MRHSTWGCFFLQIGNGAEAEAPLRRALSIDERTTNANVDADRESLAFALEAQGKLEEALDSFPASGGREHSADCGSLIREARGEGP